MRGLVPLSFLAAAAARGCPDMASLRTDYVANSFDESKISGFWYEIAYRDIAQVGESCQCFNKTIDESRSGVKENFGFTMRNPNHISLFFEHTATSALYGKYLDKSFASSTKMPTVVVDVTVNSDGSYETITEYTCFQAGPLTYEEIKIGARTPQVSDETMKELEQVVRDAGIKFDTLKYVDHTGCSYDA
jgi:lipocalin